MNTLTKILVAIIVTTGTAIVALMAYDEHLYGALCRTTDLANGDTEVLFGLLPVLQANLCVVCLLLGALAFMIIHIIIETVIGLFKRYIKL